MRKLVLLLAALASFNAAAESGCSKTGTVCVAPNETRNIQGLTVFRECWEWKDTYECGGEQKISDCQPLRDQGCTHLGPVCVDGADLATCGMIEQRYECPTGPQTYTETTVCDTATFCQDEGAGCFDTTAHSDPNFGKAVAAAELAREAGTYGVTPETIEVFKGKKEECSIKVLGGTIANCCKSADGGDAFTNKALVRGSAFVYDALYIGGPAVTLGLVAAGVLLECKDPEKELASKRGQSLCVHVGSYCDNRVLGTCVEKKEQHCCFNSKLAKIINRQGREQLGLPLDSCAGFNEAQLQSIDFSKIDLTEFIDSIVPTAPNEGEITDRAAAEVDQRVQDYYSQ